MIGYDFDTIFSELQQEEEKILKAVDNFLKASKEIEIFLTKQDSFSRRQNPAIVKSVIRYIASGYSQQDAITLTAKDFMTNSFRVETVFQTAKKHMSAVKLYAKKYTCEKLKKAGFTAKKIAGILGISENHVYKLLRCDINFD